MKRISDFTDCRIDMKQMAAVNGGARTSSSTSKPSGASEEYPCGDTMIFTTTDDTNCGGTGTYCEWYGLYIKANDCPENMVAYQYDGNNIIAAKQI